MIAGHYQSFRDNQSWPYNQHLYVMSANEVPKTFYLIQEHLNGRISR